MDFIKNKIDNYILVHFDRLLKRPNIENGFVEVKPTKTDFVHKEGTFGYVSKEKLLPDCQWDKFRTTGELQKRQQKETMACVTFSAMNCLEQIINFHIKGGNQEIVNVFTQFGLIKDGEANFSDRYIAKMSGTTMRGNSQTTVAKTIRKFGLVPEDMWGWDTNNYYANVPQNIIDRGKELLEYIEFSYEWVSPSEFNTAKVYAPIQTSVYAWGEQRGGIFQRTSFARNHAVDNDGFVMSQYDKIFDSYQPFDKKVSWDFNMGMGMIFTISLKKKLPNPVDKFIEDYDGKNVKSKENSSIYHIQQGKKKPYHSWLAYLAFNGLDRGYKEVPNELIDATPLGENMDIKKSIYWKFLENLKEPDNMNKLLEILIKDDN